jgi:nitrite reductase/ring-hydroxylating ferredoxin subunit
MMSEATSSSGCDGCPHAPDRRAFMRAGAVSLVGMLAGMGAGANALAALPVAWARGARTARGVTYPVPVADGAQIDEANQVILVRWQSAVYAFSLACPHQRTALRWNVKQGGFRCPKHKSEFQPDGTLVGGKAKRAMDRYALVRSNGNVDVDTSRFIREPDDPAAWRAAVVRLQEESDV